MKPRTFAGRREPSADPAVQRSEGARDEIATLLRSIPFLHGKLITVTLTAFVTKKVRHGLGVPAACFPIRMSTSTGVVSEDTVAHDKRNELPLVSTTGGTFDLWVYPRSSKPINPRTGQSDG